MGGMGSSCCSFCWKPLEIETKVAAGRAACFRMRIVRFAMSKEIRQQRFYKRFEDL